MTRSVIPPTPSTDAYKRSEMDYPDIFSETEPYGLFEGWMEEAQKTEINDPNAMSLATVDANGLPDVRMLLLKGVDVDENSGGFVFYTNEDSVKGQHLLHSQNVALCFHWKSLKRSVRIRGLAKPVTPQESDVYFAKRARGSQIGAWASMQSAPLESRQALEAKIKAVEARFKGQDIPRPANWYGWRVLPIRIEFWRDRPFRLHDRLVFTKPVEKEAHTVQADRPVWEKQRLFP